MSAAGVDPRRRNHIRSIQHHFLSETETRSPIGESGSSLYQVMICGTPGSPWILPLAANLSLVASQGGESCWISSSGSVVPVLARLLGASHDQMGLDLQRHQQDRILQPHPGLTLVPDTMLPLLAEQPSPLWHFRLSPAFGVGGAWLFLQDEIDTDGFLDPRQDGNDPLFLLGKDRQPRPHPAAYGIWGRLPGELLVCPERPSWPAVLGRSPQARNQYNGYLQALKRVLTSHRGDSGPTDLMGGRL